MTLTPLSPHIGARLDGLSLNALTDDEFTQLYQAFLEYKVLVVPKQQLTPAEHLKFGKRFGELEPPHPFFPHVVGYPQIVVIETAPGNPPGESFWHTDMTFQSAPPKCSILHAQHLPDQGGDTLWCNMGAVLESLPSSLREQLTGQQACHQLHAFAGSRYDHTTPEGESVVTQKSRDFPPVHHPLIAQHPETGEHSLFINEQFTRHIDGLSDTDSQALLDELFQLARQPEFQMRHTWQVGDIVIWDNRITQHYAVTDYGDAPRKLHRVTVQGQRTLAVTAS
ncbi:taurine catabolism dioxygenase [Marinomonas piezotolerans]|uniref:Taurine catabolism dioxygenase n=1 Tax=Marinomonas piezotolerans TaxID=2213058 RepID=A0A370UBN3_9GAMM|nr:TauD/TfdA family dioxygenase [Marinomonas piezotolerans]RDL45184.1 taurine catabolism dioxygenase [Marinomonas piezotolerans]